MSANQLLFYALLYHLHYKVLPSQLGFFYYRFNTYVPVPISLDILNGFRAKLSADVTKIVSDTEFKANPCYKACKYCNYQSICMECQKARADRKKTPELGIPNLEGPVEFGL